MCNSKSVQCSLVYSPNCVENIISGDFDECLSCLLDLSVQDYDYLMAMVVSFNALKCCKLLLDKLYSPSASRREYPTEYGYSLESSDYTRDYTPDYSKLHGGQYGRHFGYYYGSSHTTPVKPRVGQFDHHLLKCAMLGRNRLLLLLLPHCTPNAIQDAFYEAIQYDRVETVLLFLRMPEPKVTVSQHSLKLAMKACGKSRDSVDNHTVLDLLVQQCQEVEYVKYLSSSALKTLTMFALSAK